MVWTPPRTWAPGEKLTAALLNLHVRDNLLFLRDAADDTGWVSLTLASGYTGTLRMRVFGNRDFEINGAVTGAYGVAGSITTVSIASAIPSDWRPAATPSTYRPGQCLLNGNPSAAALAYSDGKVAVRSQLGAGNYTAEFSIRYARG